MALPRASEFFRPSTPNMLARTLLYLTVVTAGAMGAQVGEEIVTWTKPGVRYRAVSITLPPASIVTEVQTATISLRSPPSPVQRSVKRAFLNQWSFQGCVADDDNLSALTAPFPYQLSSDEVSGAACMHFCDERGNTFAATQNGNECWCGDESSASNITHVDQSQCNAACAGAAGERCGGKNSLTIYSRTG